MVMPFCEKHDEWFEEDEICPECEDERTRPKPGRRALWQHIVRLENEIFEVKKIAEAAETKLGARVGRDGQARWNHSFNNRLTLLERLVSEMGAQASPQEDEEEGADLPRAEYQRLCGTVTAGGGGVIEILVDHDTPQYLVRGQKVAIYPAGASATEICQCGRLVIFDGRSAHVLKGWIHVSPATDARCVPVSPQLDGQAGATSPRAGDRP